MDEGGTSTAVGVDDGTPSPDAGPQRGRWWRVALGPALFLLVELLFRPQAPAGLDPVLIRHALAAIAWIAAWWFTEAIPLPATSLLPLVLFPLLGLGTARDVARCYGDEVIFLFLGGFLLAIAFETTGLHQRVAFRIIRLFGSGRRALVLGFMVATATMSLWISNTAATVMMLPVALAVLAAREDEGGRGAVDQPFAVALLLGIAFAANIGGLGTPVGSPPNLAFMRIYADKTGQEVSFFGWMQLAMPVVVVLLPVCWWMLVRRIPRSPGETAIDLPRFGPMTRAQWWVLGTFTVTVVLWMTRGNLGDPDHGGLRGWGEAMQRRFGVQLEDSTVAIAAALVLFMVPSRRGGRPILDWSVAPRLPWGVLLLMGAGFAISRAFETGGLTPWIGECLTSLGRLPWPEWLLFVTLVAGIVVASILVTEFASNTASASILLPIVFGISLALGAERFPPLLLMFSCTIACSLGFAVPAGTPPNALVFATERISIGRFVRTGLALDLIAAVVVVVLIGGRRGL